MKPSRKKTLAVGLGAMFAAVPLAAIAVDAVSIEAAAGNDTDVVRANLQWNWKTRWWESNGTHIGGYWDAGITHWHGNRYQNIAGARQDITSIGITPVLRYQSDDLKGFFAEAGIGVHLMSEPYDNNGRTLSTDFQFGDHIGFGYVFQNRMELGLGIQHFSNAGIKKPNGGVNFTTFHLRHWF